MARGLIRLFCIGSGVIVLAHPLAGHAADFCAALFANGSRSTSSPLWISQMVELRNDIAASTGPLRVALAEEWKKRLNDLNAEDRAVLSLALRGQRDFQAPNPAEETANLKLTKSEQVDQLSFLPRSARKAVVQGSFDFHDLRTGFSDHDPYYHANKVSIEAGVQWGSEGNFAAIRESVRSSRTLIVDLQTGTQRVLPGGGRLSAEGNLFVQVGNPKMSLVHDLRSGAIFEVAGQPALDRYAMTDKALITEVPNDRGWEKLFLYHDLSGPSPKTYALGSNAVWNEGRQRIATEVDERLKIFDTRSLTFVDHPLAKQKVFSFSHNDRIAAGFVQFSQRQGLPGFRRERKMILSLDDLKVHRLDDRGLDWSPIAGTDLIVASENLTSRSKPKRQFLRSLQTGQEVEVEYRGAWPFAYRHGGQIWIEIGSNFFIQDAKSLVITRHKDLPQHLRLNDSGLYQVPSEEEFRFYDPIQGNWLELPKPQGDGVAVIQRDRERVLYKQYEGPNRLELMEVGFDGGWGQSLQSEYVQFSRDSKWVAIEVNGAVEIHRIAP